MVLVGQERINVMQVYYIHHQSSESGFLRYDTEYKYYSFLNIDDRRKQCHVSTYLSLERKHIFFLNPNRLPFA